MQANVQSDGKDSKWQRFFLYAPSSEYKDELYGDAAIRELCHLTSLRQGMLQFQELATECRVAVSGASYLFSLNCD